MNGPARNSSDRYIPAHKVPKCLECLVNRGGRGMGKWSWMLDALMEAIFSGSDD